MDAVRMGGGYAVCPPLGEQPSFESMTCYTLSMSPHRVMSLAVALLAGAAVTAPAIADQPAPPTATDDEREARALANVVVTALATGETGVLTGAMRAPLTGEVALTTAACRKQFKAKGRVARGKLAAYSRCLVALGLDLRGREVVVLPAPPGLVVATSNDEFNLRMELVRVKQEWKVAEIGLQVLGEEEGVEGGVAGGVLGGISSLPPPPPPPPPPPSPQTVAPTALETMRLSGTKVILPDQATKDGMVAAGKTQVVVPVKLCVDKTGAVSSTRIMKSSGFPDYDRLLEKTIRTTWTYRPFQVNGHPTAICSVVTFIYRQTP